ncbi:MAG: CDP-alcohol phosphatidyltransferase family protein [Ignavibacteriae bacterium]|nr:CDP-alcohol phosphatidyltransferase family protein [Ignavibacteriota bacterium]
MTLIEEYKKSLKMAEAEEILDLLLYRPAAFVIVKLIYRLPITPNQVTYGSLIAGLIAAYEFSLGNAAGYLWGAIWFTIANVLDCGDGMLARLQKSGTPLGRIVDGIVDWVVSVAIFYGLAVGMTAEHSQPLYWLLAVAAGVLSGYHAMVFDKRQQEYISTVRGERNFAERESEKVTLELQKGGNPLRRLLLTVYAWYMKVQGRSQAHAEQPRQYPAATYRLHNKGIMRWWTFLGPTTNRSMLIIAGALALPDWFCWMVIVPVNIYLAAMILWQRHITRRMEKALASSTLQSAIIAA